MDYLGDDMITCSLCNKNFKDRRTFGLHLATTEATNFKTELDKEIFLVNTLFGTELVRKTLNDYQSNLLCTHDVAKSNINIVKLITLMGIKRTSKEERLTERYKKKYLGSIQNKYGSEITNVSQLPEVRKKIEETCSAAHGSYENYLAKQREIMAVGYQDFYIGTEKHRAQIEKMQDTCEERYGTRNFGQGIDAKAKYQKSIKARVASWDHAERLERTSKARAAVTSRGGYSSKPEKRIRQCLVELDINFEANKFLWKYSFDMVFDKLIIEVQGDMWHANPLTYKENDLIMGKLLAKNLWDKDARKKKKAEENGYKMVYIWEHEISKKSDAELIELVKSKLLESGYVFN